MSRLAGNNVTAATDVTLYTCPTNQRASISVSLCNRGAAPVKVRLALVASGGSVSTTDYIEYDTPIEANGALERSGIILSSGQFVVVRTDIATVSAVVWGVEEQA